MIIADDEGDAVESAFLEGGEEGAPVDFGLADRGADAKDGTGAVGSHPDGQEYGGIEYEAVATNLLVSGIEDALWNDSRCFL